MLSQKSKKISKVALWIENAIMISDRSQKEIAERAGYASPNNISLLKSGATKLSLNKIKILADALDADSGQLLRVTLSEYYPDILAVMDEHKSMVSFNEDYLLREWRKATDNQDPFLNDSNKEIFIEAISRMKF